MADKCSCQTSANLGSKITENGSSELNIINRSVQGKRAFQNETTFIDHKQNRDLMPGKKVFENLRYGV